MIKTGILGNHAEKLAAKYLKSKGLVVVKRNYRCKLGEIDLIMRHQEYLVFVEVRYRKSNSFGGAAASIDAIKQAKLTKAAQHYMVNHDALNKPVRFDVICLSGDLNRADYQWISNAF